MFPAARSRSVAMLTIVKLPQGWYLEYYYRGSGCFPHLPSCDPSSCGFSPCVSVALSESQCYIPLKAQGRKQSLPGLIMHFSSPKRPMGTQALPGSAHWKIIEVDFFVLEQTTLLKHKIFLSKITHICSANYVPYPYISIHIWCMNGPS